MTAFNRWTASSAVVGPVAAVFEPAEDAGDIPESVRFRPATELTPETVATITEQVRIRVLRYCARPTFALERLDDERVVYRLPKPQRDGRTALSLTSLELVDHLAALIPPPKRHRHRYHGVLAPKSPLRADAARCPSAFRRLSQIPAGAVSDGIASFAVTQEVGAGGPVTALSGSWESIGW